MHTVFPIGTTIYNPKKCYNGYTILTQYMTNTAARIFQRSELTETAAVPNDENGIAIIDMNGHCVHAWNLQAFIWPELQPNGNLLMFNQAPERCAAEFDWSGKLVWKCIPPDQRIGIGAVVTRLTNGNTLINYKMYMPDAARLRISDPERRKMNGLQSDCIAEVTPSGAVVWDWKSHDHLDLDGWCRNDPSSNWIHFNHIQPLPENRWYDAGDLRFKPGNILVSGRSLGFIFIIEKETGEIVWRYYGDYNGGLSGQHSPLMIGKGYPGEGNILVYDNGQSPLRQDMHGGRTYILEINPSSSGIVWAYSGGDGYYRPYRFFSPYGGHCVRLPNGNTLATETMSNRAFEVTMEGEIVWEHVGNPDNIELTMCARRIPYDACPQLAALPKPRETEVVPPAHAILKPKNPIQRTE